MMTLKELRSSKSLTQKAALSEHMFAMKTILMLKVL